MDCSLRRQDLDWLAVSFTETRPPPDELNEGPPLARTVPVPLNTPAVMYTLPPDPHDPPGQAAALAETTPGTFSKPETIIRTAPPPGP